MDRIAGADAACHGVGGQTSGYLLRILTLKIVRGEANRLLSNLRTWLQSIFHHDASFGLILLCLLGTGCDAGARARSNPLDPMNPVTQGRPQNLSAIAGHNKAGIAWTGIDVTDLRGYRLYRRQVAGPTTVTDLGDSLNQFVDRTVEDGATYVYRLSAVIEIDGDAPVFESPQSDSAIVTPGPETPWLIDDGLGLALRMSPDARAAAQRVASVFAVRFLAVDPRDGGCWMTTRFGGLNLEGTAFRFSASGRQELAVSGFTIPGAVEVDPRNGTIWVADTGMVLGLESAVSHLSSSGMVLERLTDVVEPQALAVDPNTGDCWISDPGARALIKVDQNGVVRFTLRDIGKPGALAVDPNTGDCWGIDTETQAVFKLRGKDGARAVTVRGLVRPVRLTCSPLDGNCWIADEGGGAVIILSTAAPDGYDITVRRDFHAAVTSFEAPSDIDIDTRTGNAWVVDSRQGSLSKLSPDGSLIRRFRQLSRPIAVAVDPGPRQVAVIP